MSDSKPDFKKKGKPRAQYVKTQPKPPDQPRPKTERNKTTLADIPNKYRRQRIQRFIANKDSKPSMQQIMKKHPGMIPVQRDPNYKASYADMTEAMDKAYQLSNRDHLNPTQVYQKIKNHDAVYQNLYKRLKYYVSSSRMQVKMRQFISGKFIKQTADKLKIPMKDAAVILVLDDFWDDIKQKASDIYHGARQFYQDNKHIIHPLVKTLISKYVPQASSIFDVASTLFGGKMMSQDPYAVDYKYLACLFGLGPAHYAPRRQSHYMYMMTSRVQVPVITLSDGTAILVVSPYGAFAPAWANGTIAQFPFAVVSSGSTSVPYATSPNYGAAGPFYQQRDNVAQFAIDFCSIQFIETQSLINIQGKLEATVFYEPPNKNWFPGANGVNVGAPTIQDSEITNNLGFVKRWGNSQLTKLTRIISWIPNQLKSDPVTLNTNTPNPAFNNGLDYIILKFTGCTSSKNIGTAFINIGVSIQPISSMRNILRVTPRGSYPGTYSALRQCRKLGYMLQFYEPAQASFLCKQNFSEIDFGCGIENVKIGQGQAIVPVGYFIAYNPTRNGFCVQDSLQFLGIKSNLGPWASYQKASLLYPNILTTKNGQIISEKGCVKGNQYVLVLDVIQKHCFVVYRQGKQVKGVLCTQPVVCGQSLWRLSTRGIQRAYSGVFNLLQTFPCKLQTLPFALRNNLAKCGYSYDLLHQTWISSSQFVSYYQFQQWQSYTGSIATIQRRGQLIYIIDNDTAEFIVARAFTKRQITIKTGLLFPIGQHVPLDQNLIVSNSLDLNSLTHQQYRIHQMRSQNTIKNFSDRDWKLRTVQKNPGPYGNRHRNKRSVYERSSQYSLPQKSQMNRPVRISKAMRKQLFAQTSNARRILARKARLQMMKNRTLYKNGISPESFKNFQVGMGSIYLKQTSQEWGVRVQVLVPIKSIPSNDIYDFTLLGNQIAKLQAEYEQAQKQAA